MPPAKRAAARKAPSSTAADPTPEVSSVAKRAAPRKTSTPRSAAGSSQPTKASGATGRATKAASGARTGQTTTGTRASRPNKAAKAASGTAAHVASETAVRVGGAVGSVVGVIAGTAEKAAGTAEKAAGTAGKAAGTAEKAAGTARSVAQRATPARKAPAERAAAATSTASPADTSDASGVDPGPGSGSPATAGPSVFRSHETLDQVRETGRAVRKHTRRQDLGVWTPPPERPDPIDLVSATNDDRIPSLIPLRWTRMIESPFAYLRGAAAVMAYDLADSPTSGLNAQICGDAHVANFGLFASRERQQVLDVNDFDESLVGPWEFDVRRLAASIVVAGRVAGIKEKACRVAVADAVRTYRQVVHALADLPVLTAWSASLDQELAPLIGLQELQPVLKAIYGKARKNTSVRAAKRMATKQADGRWQFNTDPPELTRLPESEAGPILAGLEQYAESLPTARRVLLRRFRPVDVALRVGGLGSIGLRTYAVLLHGNGENDPMVLQVKEARTPTVGRWLGTIEPERHQGERTVAAQQLMQTASDPMLGHTRIDGRDYLVRQFRDMKGSVDATTLRKDEIDDYGRLVGALLARAHCRSLDSRLLSGYLGGGEQVDAAMIEFAMAYADQTVADHAALVQAAKDGRVPTI